MKKTANYGLNLWKAALALPGAEEARRFRGSGTIGGLTGPGIVMPRRCAMTQEVMA